MNLLFTGGPSNLQALAFWRAEVFYVEHMIPDYVGEFAEVEERRSKKLIFTDDVVAVVEGLHSSGGGCKHLRFIRQDRIQGGGGYLTWARETRWPRLKVALVHCQVKPTVVIGGFQNAVTYCDEIALPNYAVSGSSGWIVRRSHVNGYLKRLPPLPARNRFGLPVEPTPERDAVPA